MIDLAREQLLANYHQALSKLLFPQLPWMPGIIKTYKRGITQYPKSLVLHFNYIRTCLHFGNSKQVSQGLNLLQEVVNRPKESWKVNVFEDVLPYDFCPNFFNYRSYFDLIMISVAHSKNVEPSLINLLLASLHYYLGIYFEDENYLIKAVSLDPDFPNYELSLAKHYLTQNESKETVIKAQKHLRKLAVDSTVFLQAIEIIRSNRNLEFIESDDKSSESETDYDLIRHRLKYLENFPEIPLKLTWELLLNPYQSPTLKGNVFKQAYPTYTFIILSSAKKIVKEKILRVGEEDILPYEPAPGITTQDLLARIKSMENTKFWKIQSFFDSPYTVAPDATREELLNRIREMESTKAWIIRNRWCNLKWNILQNLKKIIG